MGGLWCPRPLSCALDYLHITVSKEGRKTDLVRPGEISHNFLSSSTLQSSLSDIFSIKARRIFTKTAQVQ